MKRWCFQLIIPTVSYTLDRWIAVNTAHLATSLWRTFFSSEAIGSFTLNTPKLAASCLIFKLIRCSRLDGAYTKTEIVTHQQISVLTLREGEDIHLSTWPFERKVNDARDR